jgi:hypothetical protein
MKPEVARATSAPTDTHSPQTKAWYRPGRPPNDGTDLRTRKVAPADTTTRQTLPAGSGTPADFAESAGGGKGAFE